MTFKSTQNPLHKAFNSTQINADIFWSKTNKAAVVAQDTCWEWQKGKHRHGYGVTNEGGKDMLSHRVSWLITNGPIPAGLCVLHRCDNRACCNPHHLFLGTQADNMTDKAQKGRGGVKLNTFQVRTIRRLLEFGTLCQREIGEMFGVSQVAVSTIKLNKNWRYC